MVNFLSIYIVFAREDISTHLLLDETLVLSLGLASEAWRQHGLVDVSGTSARPSDPSVMPATLLSLVLHFKHPPLPSSLIWTPGHWS